MKNLKLFKQLAGERSGTFASYRGRHFPQKSVETKNRAKRVSAGRTITRWPETCKCFLITLSSPHQLNVKPHNVSTRVLETVTAWLHFNRPQDFQHKVAGDSSVFNSRGVMMRLCDGPFHYVLTVHRLNDQ